MAHSDYQPLGCGIKRQRNLGSDLKYPLSCSVWLAAHGLLKLINMC